METTKVLGFVAGLAFLFLLAIVIVRALWGWVVPDLMPGLVDQGMVLGRLTFYQAFKLTVVLSLSVGSAR